VKVEENPADEWYFHPVSRLPRRPDFQVSLGPSALGLAFGE
jgi:hypothetical protein